MNCQHRVATVAIKPNCQCTSDGWGLLHAVDECCWENALPEAALLAGTRQELREQDQAQFYGGRMKVGLQKGQEPIAAQGVEQPVLLSGENTSQVSGLIHSADTVLIGF